MRIYYLSHYSTLRFSLATNSFKDIQSHFFFVAFSTKNNIYEVKIDVISCVSYCCRFKLNGLYEIQEYQKCIFVGVIDKFLNRGRF